MTTPAFRPDPRLFPFESRWFDGPGGRVHYLDEGEGAPILLLHGNPTWSFVYRGVIIRLRKQYRCIAPDYPGFGLSEHPPDYRYTPAEHAEVIRALVQELDLEDLTVVGHDWGGPIGMRLALDEVDRLRALVMGNTWYWPLEAVHLRAFGWLMSTGYVQSLIHKRNLFVEKIIPVGVKHTLADEVMEHYRMPFPTMDSRAGVAELARQLTRSANWLDEIDYALPDTLGNVPLLLTWGMEDLAFTPAFMDRFRSDFARSRAVRLEAKHFIQEDAPAEMSGAIREFLEEDRSASQ